MVQQHKEANMKKLIIVALCLLIAVPAFAAHTEGPINVDRVVTGSNNYGEDPNPTKDITLANDENIDNSTDGNIVITADSVVASAVLRIGTDLVAGSDIVITEDLSIGDNITALDSINSSFVVDGDLTMDALGDLLVEVIDSLDTIYAKNDLVTIESDLKVIDDLEVGADLTIGDDIVALDRISDLDSITTSFVIRGDVKLGTLGDLLVEVIDSLDTIYAKADLLVIESDLKTVDDLEVGADLTIGDDIVALDRISDLDSITTSFTITGDVTMGARGDLEIEVIDSLDTIYAKNDMLYIESDLTILGDAYIATAVQVPTIDSLATIYAAGDTCTFNENVKVTGDIEIDGQGVPVVVNSGGTDSPVIQYGALTNPTAVDTIHFPQAFTTVGGLFLQASYGVTDSTVIWSVDSISATVETTAYIHCDLLLPTSAADTCLIRAKTTVDASTLYWQAIGN